MVATTGGDSMTGIARMPWRVAVVGSMALAAAVTLPVRWAAAGTTAPAPAAESGTSGKSGTSARPARPNIPGMALPNRFEIQGFGYVIRYPGEWTPTRRGDYGVVFGGKPGTPAWFVTVAIDNRLSPRPGEPRRGAAAVLSQYVREVASATKDPSIDHHAPFLYRKDGVLLEGYQAVAAFHRNGEPVRQWVVVLPRRSGTIVHLWAYTAPVADFEDALPLARAMLDSWQITGNDMR